MERKNKKLSRVLIILLAIMLGILIYGICGDTFPHQIAKIVGLFGFGITLLVDFLTRFK